MHRPLTRLCRAAAAPLAGLALVTAAACGGSAEQQRASDSANAAGGPLGSPVGENRAANDSGFAAASERLDSLQDAGRTPGEGIDSVAARAGGVMANQPGADTSQLYNQQRTPPAPRP